MDLKQLLQTMKTIEEGCDPSIEECGGMPAIIQSEQPHDESLNMNLTINSKGADGIRELIDVLKGIGSDSENDEPKDIPTIHKGGEIVIGDDFKNAVNGDAGQKVFNQSTLTHQGDVKSREALKVNGGGQPQVHEALLQNLSALYENVKARNQKSK